MRIKICVLLGFLFCFMVSTMAFSEDIPITWKTVKLPEFDSNNVMRRVQFVSDNVGYIAGDRGIMYKTEDGGNTWTQLFTKTTADIEGMYFTDANTGWVAFSSGGSIVNGVMQDSPASLKKTIDGGATFNTIFSSDKSGIKKIIMVDANNGYAFKINHNSDSPNQYPRNLAKTSDGGASWKYIKGPSTIYQEEELSDFSPADANTCYLVTTKGEVFKTLDGGSSWTSTTLAIPTPTGDLSVKLNAVAFVDASNGWAVGKKQIFKTNDGQNWTNVTPKDYDYDYGSLFAIDAKSADEAIVTGNSNGRIMHTIDGGTSWISEKSEDNSGSFYDIAYLGEGAGFAVGNYSNGILSRLTAQEVKEEVKAQSKATKKAAAKKAVKKPAKKKKK